jgi:hypothetical protein
METKFLFMDERYADSGAPSAQRVISLSGMLVAADVQKELRDRFLQVYLKAVGPELAGASGVNVHASCLFPKADDAVRLKFLQDIVELVVQFDIKLFHIGYHPSKRALSLPGGDKGLVGLCFLSTLFCLEDQLQRSFVWPVMEIDQSRVQDQNFAGLVERLHVLSSAFDRALVSVDSKNLGEVLYVTKRSVNGAMIDCIAYILHMSFLAAQGHQQTAFKAKLAKIGSALAPAVAFNEVIRLKFEPPPVGYVAKGPVRYIVPVTPSLSDASV